jgi:hypothetical protein
MNSLVYTERHNIDHLKWDKAIEEAANGNVYAKSFLLDLMSPNWSALIMNDYEMVMPLTWRKKYGISYLYQPPFLQQLGVFGNKIRDHVPEFLHMAKNQFPFAEIQLNHQHADADGAPKQNFFIDLNRSYSDLAASYAPVHQKNLKRAANASLHYVSSHRYKAAIELNYSLYGQKSGLQIHAYKQLDVLAQQNPSQVLVREVWQEQECQASAFCLKDHRRIYFLLSAVTPAGKKSQANHFLVDQLIHEFSGRPVILDFEGSDIAGIAAFYKGFGAVNEPYYFCKWNHLPWPYRLFKR